MCYAHASPLDCLCTALDETSATLRPSEEEGEEEADYQYGKPGLEPVSEQHSASGLHVAPPPGSRTL